MDGDAAQTKWPYSIGEAELLERVERYNRQKPTRKARVAVFTANIDAYDTLVLPETIVDGWDYIVFYNRALPEMHGESIFEFREIPFADPDPARLARRVKINAHEFLPEYDLVVWLDANILVRGQHLCRAVEHMLDHDVPLMLNPHPNRNCVYEELAACIKYGKDDPDVMRRQVEGYRRQGMPEQFGLFETGINLRRNHDPRVRLLNEAWWNEVATGSRRDQLSITWVLWSKGIAWDVLPGMTDIRNHEGNDYLLFGHALNRKVWTIAYRQPDFMRRPKRAGIPAGPDAHRIDDTELERRIADWRLAARGRTGRVVVYTAIIGNRDILKIPEHLNPDWDYVCFSDRADYPGDHPWQIRPMAYLDADPLRSVSYLRANPHHVLAEYDISIWIEADLLIRDAWLDGLLARFEASGFDLAASPCSDAIDCDVLIRRHHAQAVRTFARLWWSEIASGGKSDRLALAQALHRTGLPWWPMPEEGGSIRDNPSFGVFAHRGEAAGPHPVYRRPHFLPEAYAEADDPYWRRLPPDGVPGELDRFRDVAIDIVICVHNALDDVRRCLQAVIETRLPAHAILLIDDGSDGETAEWLARQVATHEGLTLIRHEAALGYTASAAEGIAASTAPFVVLLNSDTVVSRNWALKLLQVAMHAPGIGIVGPMSNAAMWQNLPVLNDPATGRAAINALPDGLSPQDMDRLCERLGNATHFPQVPFVNGFCYGIRRDVIDAVGNLDNDTFPIGYGEEDDFSIRAVDAGFVLAVATHCFVFHAKSKSFGFEARSRLSKEAGRALRERHGKERVDGAVATMAANPILNALRAAFVTELARRGSEP